MENPFAAPHNPFAVPAANPFAAPYPDNYVFRPNPFRPIEGALQGLDPLHYMQYGPEKNAAHAAEIRRILDAWNKENLAANPLRDLAIHVACYVVTSDPNIRQDMRGLVPTLPIGSELRDIITLRFHF